MLLSARADGTDPRLSLRVVKPRPIIARLSVRRYRVPPPRFTSPSRHMTHLPCTLHQRSTVVDAELVE